ncbi:hypothetical protein CVT24_008979 [Panaeolus cyanescens]|uniref:Mitochondrial carrier n=1 Tax=Panaeolus cyanescens TaxID=181874 RepID=A0A409YAP5_9AGAR|nr:hypothetical protein CVT24_008979 [Panaeolus cyanescens]
MLYRAYLLIITVFVLPFLAAANLLPSNVAKAPSRIAPLHWQSSALYLGSTSLTSVALLASLELNLKPLTTVIVDARSPERGNPMDYDVIPPTALRKSCSSSSLFPTLTMTSTLPPLVQAFSGAIGSASANALTYPLDLVITQLQLDPPQRRNRRGGIFGAFVVLRHIIRKHGWRAIYDGLLPDTYATILSNFFYFYFYSFLRSLSTRGLISLNGVQKAKSPGSKVVHKPSLMEELILGFIAGVASRAVSTPLNIVTLKLQTERGEQEEKETGDDLDDTKLLGITDVIKGIYKEQGIGGFWKGFQTNMLLSLNPSITMAFLQMFRRIVGLIQRSRSATLKPKGSSIDVNLTPGQAFLGAAISNSIAVAILYPLILAKIRLQISSANSLWEVLADAYYGRDTLRDKRHTMDKTSQLDPSKMKETPTQGVEGLYRGLEMKTIKGFLSQGVTFLVKGRIEQLIIAAYLLSRARSS